MIESNHTDIKMVKRNVVVQYLLIVLDAYDTIDRYSDMYAYTVFIFF